MFREYYEVLEENQNLETKVDGAYNICIYVEREREREKEN
jgi:hypothetical protein